MAQHLPRNVFFFGFLESSKLCFRKIVLIAGGTEMLCRVSLKLKDFLATSCFHCHRSTREKVIRVAIHELASLYIAWSSQRSSANRLSENEARAKSVLPTATTRKKKRCHRRFTESASWQNRRTSKSNENADEPYVRKTRHADQWGRGGRRRQGLFRKSPRGKEHAS